MKIHSIKRIRDINQILKWFLLENVRDQLRHIIEHVFIINFIS